MCCAYILRTYHARIFCLGLDLSPLLDGPGPPSSTTGQAKSVTGQASEGASSFFSVSYGRSRCVWLVLSPPRSMLCSRFLGHTATGLLRLLYYAMSYVTAGQAFRHLRQSVRLQCSQNPTTYPYLGLHLIPIWLKAVGETEETSEVYPYCHQNKTV